MAHPFFFSPPHFTPTQSQKPKEQQLWPILAIGLCLLLVALVA
jgi:hypothetical protein